MTKTILKFLMVAVYCVEWATIVKFGGRPSRIQYSS